MKEIPNLPSDDIDLLSKLWTLHDAGPPFVQQDLANLVKLQNVLDAADSLRDVSFTEVMKAELVRLWKKYNKV